MKYKMNIVLGILVMSLFLFPLIKEEIYPVYLKKKYKKDIEEKIKWISSQTLLSHIIDLQYEINIDDKYRIQKKHYDDSEEGFVAEKILEAFRQNIFQSFAQGSLKKEKQFFELSDKEYFLISLLQFLNENLLSFNFSFHKNMYHPRSNNAVTEFGIIYLKLYYIVNVYCENSDKLRRYTTIFSINIKKYIDEKEI
jgi:hypothetical protein